jgi:cell division transport system permease protein
MSGSYDNPGGPRRQYVPMPPAREDADLYLDDPLTGPTTARRQGHPQHPAHPHLQRHQQPHAPGYEPRRAPHYDPEPELVAHARDGGPEEEPRRTPIVPAGSVTGRSLTLVVSIMCFLACLTAGAVYMINESASAWLRDIASEVTIQVEPRNGQDMDRTIRDLTAYLTRQPGIVAVRPLSDADSARLLENWLGQSADALKSLPIPRLIAIELDRATPPDFIGIRAQLTRQYPSALLDDHRQWQQQIRSVTRSLALGGIAILLLVAAATTAIIVTATRSALASNREIVEVLHYVGATDRFIAREFERHFLRLGIRAGLVGAGCAMVVFLVLPTAMKMLGGGTVTQAEFSRLVGTGSLDLRGYLLLLGLVVVISALCMLTSRFGVYRILHTQK